MTRTTEKLLEMLIARVNEIKNTPRFPYIHNVAQIGNYHLYSCLGCFAVDKITNLGGGVTRILTASTKSELEGLLRAYISGLSNE